MQPSAYTPTFAEFEQLARSGNVVPVCREVFADLETPVSAFLKIHRGGPGFLLESVEGGEKWGRYSFLGSGPAAELIARDGVLEVRGRDGRCERIPAGDPIAILRERLAVYRPAVALPRPRFTGGLVGYLGYDLVRFIERLPSTARDDLGLPDFHFLLADTLVVFDNVAQKIMAISNARVTGGQPLRAAYDAAVEKVEGLLAQLEAPVRPPCGSAGPGGPEEVESSTTAAEYEGKVERAKEYIRAGDVIQVVLAQRLAAPLRAAPFSVYRSLRTLNPSPYMFFLDLGDHQLAGASPEVMVRVEGGEVTLRPIAGTRPRGRTDAEDRQREAELRADPKERAEHIMLLDLGRNDVGRVARVGSVEVTEQLVVERYSHVMHLVSNVRGELAEGRDAFDALRATFPAGTLTGAPKVRAMEIIEELEAVRRGAYGGAVGYIGFGGNLDTCITIRTALMRDGRAYVQAGAGIVVDSDPAREHQECLNKARVLIEALREAERLEQAGGRV